MNAREFLTQAMLSCHKVLMEASLPHDLPDDEEGIDSEIAPIAVKVARIAACYAVELTAQWKTCMELEARFDQEEVDEVPSTKNLTKPPLDKPPSNN